MAVLPALAYWLNRGGGGCPPCTCFGWVGCGFCLASAGFAVSVVVCTPSGGRCLVAALVLLAHSRVARKRLEEFGGLGLGLSLAAALALPGGFAVIHWGRALAYGAVPGSALLARRSVLLGPRCGPARGFRCGGLSAWWGGWLVWPEDAVEEQVPVAASALALAHWSALSGVRTCAGWAGALSVAVPYVRRRPLRVSCEVSLASLTHRGVQGPWPQKAWKPPLD